MEETIRHIILDELNEEVISLKEIIGLGLVNRIYEIELKSGNYIIRINEDNGKWIEYLKEKWCLEEAIKLRIPSPKVLKLGNRNGLCFMIQNRIEGLNGKLSNSKQKLDIWYNLGLYAKKYHEVNRIKVSEVEQNNFHDNWKSRLVYNLKELNEEDSLLSNKIFGHEKHERAKAVLNKLKQREFKEGLVHGDLCPRNTIWSENGVHLLDWGTAEINVVPENEIGLVLMSNEANEKEFDEFLKGLGITKNDFEQMKEDILMLNFLHRLDKYRWAEEYDIENIEDYGIKLSDAFEAIN